MGLKVTKATASEKEQKLASKRIDKEIAVDEVKEARVQKLLLLGTAECGKSTVLKQMQLLHSNGFTDADRAERRPLIYSFVLESAWVLTRAVRALNIRYVDPAKAEPAVECVQLHLEEYHRAGGSGGVQKLQPDLIDSIQTLWADEAVRCAYQRRSEFQLSDSIKVFFDDIKRISAPNYLPSDRDMLLSRVRTEGIVKTTFIIKMVEFRVFDVAGQRSERRKWIHCFDNVNSVIFIAALSEFDQKCQEDNMTNRMEETLNVYQTVVGSVWFMQASIILFLNKKDLFEEKLMAGKSIKSAFPGYTGDNTYAAALAFIKNKFDERNKVEKTVYMHETCATDSNQVQLVIDAVIKTLIDQRLAA